MARHYLEQAICEMNISQILVIGENAGRTHQRIEALLRLGYSVDVVSHSEQLTFFNRVCNKLGFPRDWTHLNKRVLSQLSKTKYDLAWVEKCLVLKQATLTKIKKNYPGLKIIWYSEDDMTARHNQSYYFKKSLSLYDVVFTTKSYNCDPEELPALGAKKVVFVDKSYDPTFHRPIDITDEDKRNFGSEVGFIGTFEIDRFQKMLFLAKKGIKVRIWGNGWKAAMNAHPNLQVENKPIYADNYIKAICATSINLCFLRKINRDLQTDRTAEIPACGAFMLAERTNEHVRLFEENRETAYFDINNPDELYEKVVYYLAHEDERLAIARAGLERCQRGKYTHDEKLRYMLSFLQ